MSLRRIAAIIDRNVTRKMELATMLRRLGVDLAAYDFPANQAGAVLRCQQPEIVFISTDDAAGVPAMVDSLRLSLPDAAIVAYAAICELGLVRRLLEAGVRSFITAPLSLDDVREVVRATLPAPMVRRPARRLSGGRVVTVVGQKGGVGKTTIATNIAASLASDAHGSVLIIDLDPRSDVALMLNIDSEGEVVLGPDHELDAEWFSASCMEHSSGLRVLPARSLHRQPLFSRPGGVERLIEAAASHFDYVVLDTPATYGQLIRAAVDCADKIVAVTSPELASLRSACLLLQHPDLLKVPTKDLVVVLNHSTTTIGPGSEEIAAALGHPVDHEVPHDSEILIANQIGRQVVVDVRCSPSAQSLLQLTSVLAGPAVRLTRDALREDDRSGRLRLDATPVRR